MTCCIWRRFDSALALCFLLSALALPALLAEEIVASAPAGQPAESDPSDSAQHRETPRESLSETPADVPTSGVPNRGKRRPQDLRGWMNVWNREIRDGRPWEIGDSFTPWLAQTLPPDKLRSLFEELSRRYGKLEGVIDRWDRQRFGLWTFDVTRLKWERAELELRLRVSDEYQIVALWLAPGDGQAAPSGFDEADYRFGPSLDEAADANLSLHVRIENAEGEPAPGTIWFYRALDAEETVPPDAWHDPHSGNTWVSLMHGSGSKTACEHLPPGTYRVAARGRRIAADGTGDTPFGMSKAVVLDGSQRVTEVTVAFQRGSTLVVHAVDAETGQVLGDVSMSLTCVDGSLPPNWQARPLHANPNETLPAIFDDLPPGNYALTAYRRARAPQDIERMPVDLPPTIEIEANTNRDLTIRFRTARLDEAAITKRWPWVATGRVTDAQGKPIAGATVRVATGILTLLGRSTTTTDALGNYRLHFAEGFGTSDPIALQVALLSASKKGHYETQLNRQGRLSMARKALEEDQFAGWKGPQEFFLPNEPREVNFELAPAAMLQVTLLDAQGEGLAEAALRLVDPKNSRAGAIASALTDRIGRYTLSEIPVGMSWALEATAPDKELSAASLPFTFDKASVYEIKVRLRRHSSGITLLEVDSLTSNGEDVLTRRMGDDPHN